MERIIIAYRYRIEDSHAISQWRQKVIGIQPTTSIATMHERVYDALMEHHFNPYTTGDELLTFYIVGREH